MARARRKGGRARRQRAMAIAAARAQDDALSIFKAAHEHRDAPAIITATRTLTFGDCARLVRELRRGHGDGNGPDAQRTAADGARRTAAADGPRPAAPLVARATVETVLEVYRALAERRAIALLHPRLAKAELARQRAEVRATPVEPGTAFVLFTSGSTGRARGVVLSRGAILGAAAASAANLKWRPDDRWLVCLPLAHAGGLSIVVRCLVARRPIVLHEGDFDVDAVAQLAGDARATLASLVPTQLAAFVELAERPTGSMLPDSLRAILLGGAAAAPQLVEEALELDLPVRETYGLTETFGQIATARHPGDPLAILRGVGIRAGRSAAPARIHISGPMLATRYLDGEPIAPELATADLGYIHAPRTPHRRLHIVGRADDVIITGGENVHPIQVEAVLAATPGVRAACVFGVHDERWGQIVGAAVVADRRFNRQRALHSWHAKLPAHARPRRLAVLAQLPVLPNGKVDRRAAARSTTHPVAY